MNTMMIPLEKLYCDKDMVLRDYSQESLGPLKEVMKDGYNAEHPLIVMPEGDRYKILDGVRRYLVCKELGYDPIPCQVMTDEDFPGLTFLRWTLSDSRWRASLWYQLQNKSRLSKENP